MADDKTADVTEEKPAEKPAAAGAFKSAQAIKDWVRTELRLHREGHSEETRAELNP